MMIDASTKKPGSAVVPVVRYRNLPAAIDWLCGAFGFEKHRITVDSNGAFLFAQLTFGTSLIMVSPVRASAFDKLMRQPDEVGGAETQVCYFVVPDAHAHCARAKAAGAEIIFDVEDRANRGRSYSCRDLEGHLWNFGTYNPWHHQAIGHVSPRSQRDRAGIFAKRSLLAAGLLASVAAIVVPTRRIADPQHMRAEVAPIATGSIGAEEDPRAMLERLARSETASAEAEKPTIAAQHRLAKALLEMDVLRKIASAAHEKNSQAIREKEAAEHLVRELQERLVKAWFDKNAAEHASKEARRQLARERAARKAAPEEQTQAQPRMPLWQ